MKNVFVPLKIFVNTDLRFVTRPHALPAPEPSHSGRKYLRFRNRDVATKRDNARDNRRDGRRRVPRSRNEIRRCSINPTNLRRARSHTRAPRYQSGGFSFVIREFK